MALLDTRAPFAQPLDQLVLADQPPGALEQDLSRLSSRADKSISWSLMGDPARLVQGERPCFDQAGRGA